LKVVCNSSTLIALARIGHLDILQEQVDVLVIPRAVYEDVVIKGIGKPGAADVKEAGWIDKGEAVDRESVQELNTILDLGESEATVLAKEIKADMIILDEEKAREIAISKGLKVIGLVAFLIYAKEKGWIMEVKPLLDELKVKGFFMGEDLYSDVLQKVKET